MSSNLIKEIGNLPDSSYNYPSPLVAFNLQITGKSVEIKIPKNELSRVKEIFQQNEYSVLTNRGHKGKRTIIDVGANVGLFSLYMKMNYPDSQIFCFEPVPSTFELLRLNTENLTEINIFPFALFNEEKKSPFKFMLIIQELIPSKFRINTKLTLKTVWKFN